MKKIRAQTKEIRDVVGEYIEVCRQLQVLEQRRDLLRQRILMSKRLQRDPRIQVIAYERKSLKVPKENYEQVVALGLGYFFSQQVASIRIKINSKNL